MGFEFIKKLPTPDEIRNQYPIDAKIKALKEKRDQEIRDVFTGKSDKFLAIIGPCSADNEDAVCDYLLRLRKVQDKIADKVLIIPRVYTNKPRTTGEGYKGMVHQPDPEKKPNMLAGLVAIRKMHIRAIEESEFTCADEMLYPENWRYLSDLLSYVAVGARSVEDQQHRLTVSGMDEDLRLLFEKYSAKNLKNMATIVDTNHSNSNKQYEQQIRIAKEVLHSRQVDSDVHGLVKGLMIESYIEPGNQKIGPNHVYGKSITDACLGWDESEKLLYTIAEMC